MLIDISNIIVRDRIRQDFGDIQELANDIKANGLINPPVVTPIEEGKCQLIAGERRLRAMKLLGYKQVEVRPMSVRDAEHQLDLEISENAIRKGWTMTEMLEIARRKERMVAIKAKENQSSHSVCQTFGKVNSDKEAASVIDVSREQYRKMKTIEDNKSLLTPEDFADWDEGRLSTNKAFKKVKAELDKLKAEKAEAQKKLDSAQYAIQTSENVATLSSMYPGFGDFVHGGIVDQKFVSTLLGELSADEKAKLTNSLSSEEKRKFEEAIASLKSTNKVLENDRNKIANESNSRRMKIKELEEQLNDMNSAKNVNKRKFNDAADTFKLKVFGFIRELGGYAYLTDCINELEEEEFNGYLSAIKAVHDWSDALLLKLENNMEN